MCTGQDPCRASSRAWAQAPVSSWPPAQLSAVPISTSPRGEARAPQPLRAGPFPPPPGGAPPPPLRGRCARAGPLLPSLRPLAAPRSGRSAPLGAGAGLTCQLAPRLAAPNVGRGRRTDGPTAQSSRGCRAAGQWAARGGAGPRVYSALTARQPR
jgi:hypothetical protein